MLRKFLDKQLKLTEKGRPLHLFRPLIEAIDTFCYEPNIHTRTGPHIRDVIDLKRWMVLVVFALVPATLWAIWNSGMNTYVYGSGSDEMVSRYFANPYFALSNWKTIVWLGVKAVLPIVIISYIAGGVVEGLFAVARRHPISEGFLVTGILYALILPSTLPYWMVAIGVIVGTVLAKELFGGTGMNILNPALACRAFLFFTFPAQMSGDVWVGTNPVTIRKSTEKMGVSQASALNRFNISTDIKRIHVEAIAWKEGVAVPHAQLLEQFSDLSIDEILKKLNLSPELFTSAKNFAQLRYGMGNLTSKNFFFGNMIGSIGETSTLAALFGAAFLILVGIGSWRSMCAMAVGCFATALLFELGSHYMGTPMWNPAKFDLPAYKHFLLGGFAFALAFMITDPVSSPSLPLAKWMYGITAGAVTIIIRLINPAFPEGVMLAILFANVFAPLFDHIALNRLRRHAH